MLNKAPLIYRLELILKHTNKFTENQSKDPKTGEWVPARSVGYFSLRHRIKCAWMVFTGKADVLLWPGGQ